MEIKEPSCNWKKLQATFQSDTSRPPKRKANHNILRPHQHAIERRPSSMGGVSSYLTSPAAPSASLALWAEDNDIPAKDLAAAYGRPDSATVPETTYEDRINEGLSKTVEAGKYLAIDCEMVGVGPAPGDESALARVSIVNYHGHQVYDSFVQPKEAVTDYRTHVSGITPQLLQTARTLDSVQADVARLLDGKILVGHALRNDLDALFLGHPKMDIRDTSKHAGFRRVAGGRTPALKRLARELLRLDIQGEEHSSIEDARATMLLFRKEKDAFDQEHQKRWGTRKISSAKNANRKNTGSRQKKKKRVKK